VTTRVYRSLFLFCVLVLVLYGLGNVQEFLDGNQLMLLAVVRGTSLAGTVLAGYCMGFRALLAVRRARHVGRSLALDALLFAANAALLVGVEMILAWLQVPAA
jgi:hypothetical protein